MSKEEMIKEAYTLMVKNNPDEAIKNLIRLDKELDKKNKIVFKAIEYIHNNQIVFELSDRKGIQKWFDEFYKDLLDILRGKDE